MRRLRIIVGVAFWIALFSGAFYGANHMLRQPDDPVIAELQQFFSGRRKPLELEFETPSVLFVGDPIFEKAADGKYVTVGRISAVDEGDTTDGKVKRAHAVLYRRAPVVTDSTQLRYFQTSDDLQWVFDTLFPESKRKAIAARVRQAWLENQAEMLEALEPIVEAAFRDGLNVVRKDLPKALKKHRQQLTQLGSKYQQQVIERELVPLVKSEIWPIVRRYAEPTVNRVGKEIWQRASVWRFGWRLVYDKTPLVPKKNLLKKEWQRFIAKDAIPVLEKHTSEFVWLQKRIIAEVAKNPKVRKAVSKSFQRISEDPQVTRLLWKIVRETTIENDRLHRVLRDHWKRPKTQAAIQVAVERFEPIAVEIGEMVIGSERAGVTAEFAAVLRNQVLRKDQRWIVLNSTGPASPSDRVHKAVVQAGGRTTVDDNPFVLALGSKTR